jgi:hypothetical protein
MPLRHRHSERSDRSSDLSEGISLHPCYDNSAPRTLVEVISEIYSVEIVHRLASLLRASFRPRLAASVISPLRFAITSRPSRCEEDLHLQAVDPARHTQKGPDGCPPRPSGVVGGISSAPCAALVRVLRLPLAFRQFYRFSLATRVARLPVPAAAQAWSGSLPRA